LKTRKNEKLKKNSFFLKKNPPNREVPVEKISIR